MSSTVEGGKIKLSIGGFKRDFIRGLSEQELADTYSLKVGPNKQSCRSPCQKR